MLRSSSPRGYERKKPVERPKLGPWLGVIDPILVTDQSEPKQQRHTAKRIWDRRKAEHGLGGSYTVVEDYVRQARERPKEVFVPLAHPPGDAQADFGEALVVIGGQHRQSRAPHRMEDLLESTANPFRNWRGEFRTRVALREPEVLCLWRNALTGPSFRIRRR